MSDHQQHNGPVQRTILGQSFVMHGSLMADEDVEIYGQCKGKLETSKKLTIHESATVSADVCVAYAHIAGELIGTIRSTSTLELTVTGKVFGDITTKTLITAAGAILQGMCVVGELRGSVRPSRVKNKPVEKEGQGEGDDRIAIGLVRTASG